MQWHALSLNFHDYAVTVGMMPTSEGRIPISDGAGEIVEIGAGVSGSKLGDRALSLFFPDWHDGLRMRRTPAGSQEIQRTVAR